MTKGKKEHEEIGRYHVHLYKKDKEEIDRIFGGPDGIGFAKAVRSMVRIALNQMRAKAEQHSKPVQITSTEVNKIIEKEGI